MPARARPPTLAPNAGAASADGNAAEATDHGRGTCEEDNTLTMHLGICNGKGIFCHGRLSYEGCGLTTAGRGPLHCTRKGHVHPPVTAPAPAALSARAKARAIGQLIVCLGRLPEFSAYPTQQDYASRKCLAAPRREKNEEARGGCRPSCLGKEAAAGRLAWFSRLP